MENFRHLAMAKMAGRLPKLKFNFASRYSLRSPLLSCQKIQGEKHFLTSFSLLVRIVRQNKINTALMCTWLVSHLQSTDERVNITTWRFPCVNLHSSGAFFSNYNMTLPPLTVFSDTSIIALSFHEILLCGKVHWKIWELMFCHLPYLPIVLL